MDKEQQIKQKFSLGSDIQKIVNNIYIGDEDVSNNKALLIDLGIKRIVMAGKELKIYHPKDFKYLDIPVRDHRQEDITQYFQPVFKFIEEGIEQKEGILVHCRMGKSRSVTLVMAYIMKKYKVNFHEALNFVRRKRSDASPNQGFIRQLKKYEQVLKNQ